MKDFDSKVKNDQRIIDSKRQVIDIFIQEGKIDPGRPFDQQIQAELRNAKLILSAIFSPAGKFVLRKASALLMKSR